MSIELELKFRIDEPAGVRDRLLAAGAVRTHDELETNWILDTPQRALRNAASGLRVRSCMPRGGAPAHPAKITFKGPATSQPVKRREEIEIEVGDAAAARHLLEKLGFHPAIVYEKIRESWALADCVVTLDELPHLGFWLEIEGPSEPAVRAVQRLLRLENAEPVRESYVAMAANAGRTTDARVIELRFDVPV